jgi:hypothetical protein
MTPFTLSGRMPSMKPTLFALPLMLAAALAASPAGAHHAFNMYTGTFVSFDATVKDWTWKNPHAMIAVDAKMPDGSTEAWTVECSAPNIIGRRGWSKDSLHVGDHVPMTIHPMKDGSKYGLMVKVKKADGVVLNDKE